VRAPHLGIVLLKDFHQFVVVQSARWRAGKRQDILIAAGRSDLARSSSEGYGQHIFVKSPRRIRKPASEAILRPALVPEKNGTSALCGYPITLQFPPFDKVTGVKAKLTDAAGNPVEFFLSDPEHPATSFGQYGVICLIPKQSLRAQHVYSVRIDATWKAKPGMWTWSFSTVSLRGIEASVAAYWPLGLPKLARVSGSIARSPSSSTDAPRVKQPKRYLLSSSGKPPLRDFADGAASSSACTADGTPKKRGTPHIMAARLHGQRRRRGMLSSPPVLGRFAAYRSYATAPLL
jgi:hypothetical protein